MEKRLEEFEKQKEVLKNNTIQILKALLISNNDKINFNPINRPAFNRLGYIEEVDSIRIEFDQIFIKVYIKNTGRYYTRSSKQLYLEELLYLNRIIYKSYKENLF